GAAGTIEYIGANTSWSNVLHCNGNCTNPTVISGLAAGTYTVKVNMQLSSGGFCYRQEDVTVSNSSRIAPSNVFDLSANIIKKAVQLEWIASQTDETESFTIEKSIDGIHFEPIKVIADNLEDYYFKNQDENPDFGNNYYRIKQQFTSGEFQYSPIRKEAFHLDENTITLYPNPAKDELWINLGEFSKASGNVSIYNMLGQKVTHKVLTDGDKQLRFNVADYENGLYYLTIEAKGNRSITKRFVIENWK
ncbi:MAG: T9SS type A sorting domain-containing protein, partial [Saprospiraceae bacterium]